MNNSEFYSNSAAPPPGGEREALLREMMPKLGLEPQTSAANNRAEAWKRYYVPKLLLTLAAVLLAAAAAVWLFSPASFREVEAVNAPSGVTVRFTVSKPALLDSVTADLDGTPVQAENLSPGCYQLEARKNGLLTLTARTFAGRSVQTALRVADVDDEAPSVSRDLVRGGNMYIYFEDSGGSGIDWQSASVTDVETGQALAEVETNEEEGYIRFPFPDKPARISVADQNGNPLTVLLHQTKKN